MKMPLCALLLSAPSLPAPSLSLPSLHVFPTHRLFIAQPEIVRVERRRVEFLG